MKPVCELTASGYDPQMVPRSELLEGFQSKVIPEPGWE